MCAGAEPGPCTLPVKRAKETGTGAHWPEKSTGACARIYLCMCVAARACTCARVNMSGDVYAGERVPLVSFKREHISSRYELR